MKKPTPEAKALSLFLMAFKKESALHKEKAKRINKQWDRVGAEEISKEEYDNEVQNMITAFGGYDEIVEKTVQFYITKTGEWSLKGDDKYCVDAQKVANKIMKKK